MLGSAAGRKEIRSLPRRGRRRIENLVTAHYIVMQKGMSMAANALVQARIDGAVKEEAAAVLSAMGLTVSDAVRLMLTRVAQEKALPFEPLVPNATTIAAMKEAREGKGKRFATVADLMADLDADD